VLAFLLKEQAPWPRRFDELDSDPEVKVWRDELREQRGIGYFDHDPKSINIDSALIRWLQQKLTQYREFEQFTRKPFTALGLRSAYAQMTETVEQFRVELPLRGGRIR
jgi:hypothetical protein